MRTHAFAVAVLAGTVACSDARQRQGSPTNAVSWEEDVAPLFAANCNSCHSGANAAAGYQTTSYLAALGPQDKPVAVAGDPNSRLLQVLDPAKADAVHQPVSGTFPTVRAWVVDGQLSFFRSPYHPGGILNPHDPNGQFHGNLVQSVGWNVDTCGSCHGADFTGGTSGVSCTQCHAQGPTSCDTCHGQPPATGAHLAHANGAVGKKADCSECHIKPAHWNDPGHLTTPDGKPKTKAVVTFTAQSLAAQGTAGRSGPPAYDGASCSNIYCHGVTLQDPKATHTTPKWTGGSAEATCGTCHGAPPASHDSKYASNNQCTNCHQLSVAGNGSMVPSGHVDGVVEVGDNSGTCAACHGSPQNGNAAPPRDLTGHTVNTALGVGAHQAHLRDLHDISAPITCDTCHVVPTALLSPGHVDTKPPAEVVFSGLALNDQAAPVWDRNAATCSATYCHGGGQSMAGDTNAKLRTPVWTLGTGEAFCGSCHGLPPAPPHPAATYPNCSGCHPRTVTPNGAIIVSGPPNNRTSTHINGVVDVGP